MCKLLFLCAACCTLVPIVSENERAGKQAALQLCAVSCCALLSVHAGVRCNKACSYDARVTENTPVRCIFLMYIEVVSQVILH